MTVGTTVMVDVLANDSDPEGDAIQVTAITDPPNRGTATLNGDSTITYAAHATRTGTNRITYEIEDAFGLTDTARINITVVAAVQSAGVVAEPEQEPVQQLFLPFVSQ